MCGCRDEVLLELNGKTYMLSLKVYETVKTDVAYVQDKTVSQIQAKDRILEYLKHKPSITNQKAQELCGFNKNQTYYSRCTPRISVPSCSSCQRRTACARSGGQVSSSHLPSCREAVLFFPFRSLLVHEWSGLAGFRDLSEKIFCRSYLAPFVSFGLTGRNETGRGAATHTQVQAVKKTGLVEYEPQYIKSEP